MDFAAVFGREGQNDRRQSHFPARVLQAAKVSRIVRPTNDSAEIQTDSGTSNMTVADSEGWVVSLTTTVGLPFGSRIITKHGFVLNDSMDDFSVAGRPNKFGYEPSAFNFSEHDALPRLLILQFKDESGL